MEPTNQNLYASPTSGDELPSLMDRIKLFEHTKSRLENIQPPQIILEEKMKDSTNGIEAKIDNKDNKNKIGKNHYSKDNKNQIPNHSIYNNHINNNNHSTYNNVNEVNDSTTVIHNNTASKIEFINTKIFEHHRQTHHSHFPAHSESDDFLEAVISAENDPLNFFDDLEDIMESDIEATVINRSDIEATVINKSDIEAAVISKQKNTNFALDNNTNTSFNDSSLLSEKFTRAVTLSDQNDVISPVQKQTLAAIVDKHATGQKGQALPSSSDIITDFKRFRSRPAILDANPLCHSTVHRSRNLYAPVIDADFNL